MNRSCRRVSRPIRPVCAPWLPAVLILAHGFSLAAAELLPGFDDAIRVISERLVGFSDVDPARMAEGALRGVLAVVDPHAAITDADGESAPEEADAAPAQADNRTEVIADRFLYLGAGRIDLETVSALASAPVAPDACDGVIVDLRTTTGANLADAAAFVSAFVEPGTRVFSVEGSSGESAVHYDASVVSRSWQETPLVVLIGPETGPAAEAAAGGLRDLRRAVLVGHSTPGEAVERESIALPGGRTIRLAIKRVRFPSGAVLFPFGAQPDVIAHDDEEEAPLLTAHGEPPGPDQDVIADTEGSAETVDEPGLPIGVGPSLDAPAASADAPAGPRPQDDAAVGVAVDILKGFRALRARP